MNVHDEVSFLPEDYCRRKVRQRTVWIGTGVSLAIVAAIGAMALRAQASLRATDDAHAEVQHRYDEATNRFTRIYQQCDVQRKIIQHAASARSLVERVPRSNILAELTNCLPDGSSLVDVTLESRPRAETAIAASTAFDAKKAAVEARRRAETINVADTPATEIGVKLSGLADTDVDVAHYLADLHHSRLFHDVNLLISETYTTPGHPADSLRRFQIQLTVNADAKLAWRQENTLPATANVKE